MIGSTAIEESLSLSTSELVIERSLLDQTEQARSAAHQASLLRQAEQENVRIDTSMESIDAKEHAPKDEAP